MKRVFASIKKKKNKALYYTIFWIFFPLMVIALILSLCFSPNELSQNKSSAYEGSLTYQVKYTNNTNDVNNYSATQKEAQLAASNYLLKLEHYGFNDPNVQPYVYTKIINNQKAYFYGLNVLVPTTAKNAYLNSVLGFAYTLNTSSTLTLDEVNMQTKNSYVVNPVNNKNGSYNYYASNVLVGQTPINNNNDIFSKTNNTFVYSSTKIITQNKNIGISINLSNPLNINGLIKNSSQSYLLWINKAAFVSLCQNIYSLYWLYNQWDNLQGIIPAKFYNNDAYFDIQKLINSIKNSYGNFGQDLYTLVGHNNYVSYSYSDYAGALNKAYNLISLQNIDNILMQNAPSSISSGSPKSMLNDYMSQLISSYVLADINGSNYQQYFNNVVGNQSSSLFINLKSDLQMGSNAQYLIDLIKNEVKNNCLNPVVSPQNTYITNTNTYSNVLINPFDLWNNITPNSSSTVSTNSNSYQNIQLPFNYNTTLPLISYSNSSFLSNSTNGMHAWTAVLVFIIVLILIIGIIVSILYRFPGLIAWIISTMTLGINSLIYTDLNLSTTNSTMFSYVFCYLISMMLFVIFLQKCMEYYKSGVSYSLSLIKALKHYANIGFDIHVVLFLSCLAFTYFSVFEIQTIGIIFNIYWVLSFILNYLLALLIFYLYSNFDLAYVFAFANKFQQNKNKNNYNTVASLVISSELSTYYDLKNTDSVLFSKTNYDLLSTPKKIFKIISLILISVSLVVVFALMISSIYFFVTQAHNFDFLPTLVSKHNIAGSYIYHNLPNLFLIAIGFGAIYMFIRFGKAIIFFVSTSLSYFMYLALFYSCSIAPTIFNTEALVFAFLLALFINTYLNVKVDHLFKFHNKYTLKETYNIIINSLQLSKITYLWILVLFGIELVLSYIINSTSLFTFNGLIYLSLLFAFVFDLACLPYLRFMVMVLKNFFFKLNSMTKHKNYDLIEEQLITGINKFNNEHQTYYD